MIQGRPQHRSPIESEQVTLYGRAGDLQRFEAKNDLTQYVDETPGLGRNALLSRALQLWRFAKEIRAGDLIVVPSDPGHDQIAIGMVKEPYRHDSAEESHNQDAIRVRWIRKDLER
jgi:predicted Mrr-cat superfamily restriction endonuclease